MKPEHVIINSPHAQTQINRHVIDSNHKPKLTIHKSTANHIIQLVVVIHNLCNL